VVHRNPNSFVQLRDLATTRDDDHFGDRLKMLRWWPSTRPWTHRCTLQRTRQTREPWQTGALKYTKASLSALSPIKKKRWFTSPIASSNLNALRFLTPLLISSPYFGRWVGPFHAVFLGAPWHRCGRWYLQVPGGGDGGIRAMVDGGGRIGWIG